MIVHGGEAALIGTWAKGAGISTACLRYRLRVGQSIPHALRQPAARTSKNLLTWNDQPDADRAERLELFGRLSGTAVAPHHL